MLQDTFISQILLPTNGQSSLLSEEVYSSERKMDVTVFEIKKKHLFKPGLAIKIQEPLEII